jgi:hypothetical protein
MVSMTVQHFAIGRNIRSTLVPDPSHRALKCTYQAFAISLIDPDTWENTTIEFGLAKTETSKHKDIADAFKRCLEQVTGYSHVDLLAGVIQDCGALGVAQYLEQDIQKCLMHEADKVTASACGFREGLDLLDHVRKAAAKVSRSSILTDLVRATCRWFKLPEKNVKLDSNGTRIAAPHRMLKSFLELFTVYCHVAANNDQNFTLWFDVTDDTAKEEAWAELSDLEGVLSCTSVLSELAQLKHAIPGGFGPRVRSCFFLCRTTDSIHAVQSRGHSVSFRR